jgi:hypothetical protein
MCTIQNKVSSSDGDGASATASAAASTFAYARDNATGSVCSMNPFTQVARRKWDANSDEFHRRQSALTKLFAGTELSTRVVMYDEFQKFCNTLDPKFQLPGKFVCKNCVCITDSQVSQQSKVNTLVI